MVLIGLKFAFTRSTALTKKICKNKKYKNSSFNRLACHCMAVVTGMDESQLRAMVSRYCDFPSEGFECNSLLGLLPGPLDKGLQTLYFLFTLHIFKLTLLFIKLGFCLK